MIQAIDEFLHETNALIAHRLRLEQGENCQGETIAHKVAGHLCGAQSAKRARPLLCLYYDWLFDDFFDASIVPIGVAAEFIHTASLLHDDVVDEADKRRGVVSANAYFGNPQAVLSGNFLLTQAFDVLRPFKREFIDQAIVVVKEMTISALLEIESRGHTNLTPSSWYKVAKGKTGILFAWCGWAVATNKGRSDDAIKLWDLGFSIGNIFQMVDDVKDFHGDQFLKVVANDIRNKEASMPLLLAMQDQAIRQKFTESYKKQTISDDEVLKLRDLVVASQALEKTKSLILQELENVQKVLTAYDGTRGKSALDGWVNKLVHTSL